MKADADVAQRKRKAVESFMIIIDALYFLSLQEGCLIINRTKPNQANIIIKRCCFELNAVDCNGMMNVTAHSLSA